jgi:hypothetical protein
MRQPVFAGNSRWFIGCALLGLAGSLAGAEEKVRPIWGGEAMWGYWEFGDDYVSKKDWKIVSVNQEGPEGRTAAKMFDGDADTFYDPTGKDSYEVVIDLGKTLELGAFSILTLGRPNNAADSAMAKYELFVSESKENAGTAVAQGDLAAKEGEETVVAFPAARGRYVTLKAVPKPNANKELCIRELSLITAEAAARHAKQHESAEAQRKSDWQQRDSEAAVEALGKDFLDMVFCTPDDMNRSNLRGRPKLDEVGKLKAAGQYAQGLKAFRDYYFEKLRKPQSFGISAGDLHPFGKGVAGIDNFPQAAMDKDLDAAGLKKQVAAADALLQGRMTLGNGTVVTIGEPGGVDWWAPAQPYGYTTKDHQPYPYRELWHGTGFLPLFTAYIATKDEKYLRRWVAYMDDWAMNPTFLSAVHPVINHDDSLYPVVPTIRMFAAIAAALPYDSEAVPPAAFARIMKKLATESPLNHLVYFRSNPNAWTPGGRQLLLSIFLDEFKAAPIYFRDARRRQFEDINVLQMLPDGTDEHQWPGYNPLLMVNAAALRLMDARELVMDVNQPVWEKEMRTPAWQRELREALERRATYYLHWAAPNGEFPLVTHQEPAHEKKYKLREVYSRLPTVYDDLTNAKLFSTMYGDGSAGVPAYNSEWFPYGGYSIARDGWQRDSGYASMFCSPKPGCGGVGSGCKNNAFSLAAFGMPLLSEDLVHAYAHTTSPIQVDGRRQQLDFYVPKTAWPTGHRGDLISDWQEPSPWRWHASERFNLMEGVYSGVYANDFYNRKDFLDDVSHQRLALYSRRAGLWVLTDRMTTPKPHEYEQIWWLPLGKKEAFAFAPGEITVDAAAKTIKTARTITNKAWSWDQLRDVEYPNANLSMYQFTDAAVKYESKPQKSGEMYDWQRVSVKWNGEGDQQVVTALFPRKPTAGKKQPDGTENDLVGMKPIEGGKGVTAFEAVTPDGFHVTYLAAANRAAVLEQAGVRVVGEALLVVTSDDEKEGVTGVVLGAKELAIKGASVPVPRADFEFALPKSMDAKQFRAEPIYRPISPVQVLPESDVFAGEQEVTLRCETPGVFMTYTLDGTEPTPQSARYAAPFKIDRTRTIKARAYRPGVESNPVQTSGTHATPTAFAVYTKKFPSVPESITPGSPGLVYEYFEGYWKDLWLSLDKQPIKKRGTLTDLFDFSVIPDDNAPVGDKLAPREKAYAFRYTGFINVPEDGVYTFHAPHEYTHCDQVAGYELQLYVGHASMPDNNSFKRDGDLDFWYPATRAHGFGTWSVPLKKGYHDFKVVYIDFRTDSSKRLNRVENVRAAVWDGEKPALLVSGPGIPKQPIPASWLWR